VSANNAGVEVVRRFYQALAEGDTEAALDCFAPDAVWMLQGAQPHRRPPGRPRRDPRRLPGVDVAVGQRHVVAVQHATAEHRARRLDVTGCQLIPVEHGRIAEVRGHYSNHEALDAFWS
jgi:ketosteroid isomerase-like protein